MCIICSSKAENNNYKALLNSTILDCWDCSMLTEIPIICVNNLTQLILNNCINLTVIPNLSNLQKLYCNNCKSLTEIPILTNLTELDCISCPVLTTVHIFPKLIKYNCNNCPLLNNGFNINVPEVNIKNDKQIELINAQKSIIDTQKKLNEKNKAIITKQLELIKIEKNINVKNNAIINKQLEIINMISEIIDLLKTDLIEIEDDNEEENIRLNEEIAKYKLLIEQKLNN